MTHVVPRLSEPVHVELKHIFLPLLFARVLVNSKELEAYQSDQNEKEDETEDEEPPPAPPKPVAPDSMFIFKASNP